MQDSDVTVSNPMEPSSRLQYVFPRSLSNLWLEHQNSLEQGTLPGVTMDDLQFSLFEYHWFLPTLLSTFSHRMFCKLLTAVLLERSIVFVDDNLPQLTSIVLGLKTLIRPFNWCGSLVPIMPSGLQETIFSPFSVLIGITSIDYEQIIMSSS